MEMRIMPEKTHKKHELTTLPLADWKSGQRKPPPVKGEKINHQEAIQHDYKKDDY